MFQRGFSTEWLRSVKFGFPLLAKWRYCRGETKAEIEIFGQAGPSGEGDRSKVSH